MPSFNGSNIFGSQVKMATSCGPRGRQSSNYFGLDGTEELDGGFVERVTSARGRLFGLKSDGGLGDLLGAITAFDNLNNGRAYTLVDTFEQPWRNVKMEAFDLDIESGVMQSPHEWFVFYTATFRHLSRY